MSYDTHARTKQETKTDINKRYQSTVKHTMFYNIWDKIHHDIRSSGSTKSIQPAGASWYKRLIYHLDQCRSINKVTMKNYNQNQNTYGGIMIYRMTAVRIASIYLEVFGTHYTSIWFHWVRDQGLDSMHHFFIRFHRISSCKINDLFSNHAKIWQVFPQHSNAQIRIDTSIVLITVDLASLSLWKILW